MAPTRAHDSVLAARRSFFTNGVVPPALANDPIVRSWKRCAALGLDVAAKPRVEALSSYELRTIQEQNEHLRRLCRPEMEALHAEARETGSVIVLTDAGGLILDAMGSVDFLNRAAQVALQPGATWSEARSGTNAIGTALSERIAFEVRGAEHFFEPHGILSCAAVPIIDPFGDAVGVIDMSCHHAAQGQSHAIGLVRFAVQQIEHRFFDDKFAHCHVVRLHSERSLLGTAREGILVFENNRLVAANRHGLKLTGLDWSQLHNRHFNDLFAQNPARLAPDTALTSLDGAHIHARITPPKAQALHGLRPAPRAPQRLVANAPILGPHTAKALDKTLRLLEADIPILVQGETGTGKEVFARQVHARGCRSDKPFIAVNCAALPESLIESELFGYEDGAFTGARKHGQKGLLREADGGVLFLDEIGDMPLALQARLLRVLQEREVRPLGGGKSVAVDFALLCASHRNLKDLVAENRFRSDLYFRIAQFTVELPPLRDLPDRLALIRSLWQQMSGTQRIIGIAREAEEALALYQWPGNFREMTGVLRALLALADEGTDITPDDLPRHIMAAQPACATHDTPLAISGDLDGITREAMRAALKACDGNVSQAARRLGVHRSTLYRRLMGENGPKSH